MDIQQARIRRAIMLTNEDRNVIMANLDKKVDTALMYNKLMKAQPPKQAAMFAPKDNGKTTFWR